MLEKLAVKTLFQLLEQSSVNDTVTKSQKTTVGILYQVTMEGQLVCFETTINSPV